MLENRRRIKDGPMANIFTAALIIWAAVVWLKPDSPEEAETKNPSLLGALSVKNASHFGNPQPYQVLTVRPFNIPSRDRADAWITASVVSIEDATATTVKAAKELLIEHRKQAVKVMFYQVKSSGEKASAPVVTVSWALDGKGWKGNEVDNYLKVDIGTLLPQTNVDNG